jgi:ketosteroid isomerase-like protein
MTEEEGMAEIEFDQVSQQAWDALDRIVRGDPTGYKALYSQGEDITLANPFGGIAHGVDEVSERLDRAASYYRDGHATAVDRIERVVTPELAYTVEIERAESKVGGSPEASSVAVRVTCIYRREEDGWKLVHRHADPRVSLQEPQSVLEE